MTIKKVIPVKRKLKARVFGSAFGRALYFAVIAGFVITPFSLRSHVDKNPAEAVFNLDRPIIIGHRGYKAFAPENTMPSMELAVQSGCDLIELDVHFSSDRIPVVIHDKTLDRTTSSVEAWGNQKVSVKDQSVGTLSTLDAGAWYHPRYEGTGIPILEDVLEYIHEEGTVTLIDRKAGEADEFLELLENLEMKEAVIIQAFDWEFLAKVHALDEDIILSGAGPARTWQGKSLSTAERALSKEWIDRARGAGARALAWNDQISREALDYAHEKGMKVWVYTINDEKEAQRMLDLGIDGVITDNPAVLWRAFYLQSRQEIRSGD